MVRKMAVAMLVAGVVALSSRPAVAQAMAGAGSQSQMLVAPAVPVTAPTAAAPGAAAVSAVTGPARAVAGAATPREESAVARYGPSVVGAALLAPASATTEQPQPAHVPAYRQEPGVALMIVGGALFLGGAIVGDRPGDALMVGGVVVAAIGLYQYLE